MTKQTVKDAHVTIIMAEKVGVNADHLREMLIELKGWEEIQSMTKDLKTKVELEEMRAQVKADITQDMSQLINQTSNQTMDHSTRKDTVGQTTGQTTSLEMPFVETMVAMAGMVID